MNVQIKLDDEDYAILTAGWQALGLHNLNRYQAAQVRLVAALMEGTRVKPVEREARPLFDHPDEDSYIDSLEAALGWWIRRYPYEMGWLKEETAIEITPAWAEHLLSKATHPDD